MYLGCEKGMSSIYQEQLRALNRILNIMLREILILQTLWVSRLFKGRICNFSGNVKIDKMKLLGNINWNGEISQKILPGRLSKRRICNSSVTVRMMKLSGNMDRNAKLNQRRPLRFSKWLSAISLEQLRLLSWNFQRILTEMLD